MRSCRHRIFLFTLQFEGNAATRDYFKLRGIRKEFGNNRRRRDQLFKIIQDQKGLFIAQIIFDIFQQRTTAFPDFQVLGNSRDKLIGIGIVSQWNEECAVRELLKDILRNL